MKAKARTSTRKPAKRKPAKRAKRTTFRIDSAAKAFVLTTKENLALREHLAVSASHVRRLIAEKEAIMKGADTLREKLADKKVRLAQALERIAQLEAAPMVTELRHGEMFELVKPPEGTNWPHGSRIQPITEGPQSVTQR